MTEQETKIVELEELILLINKENEMLKKKITEQTQSACAGVSPIKGRTSVIFINEDHTKSVTMSFRNEGEGYTISINFNPELDMEHTANELYQNLASRFIDIVT